MASKVTKRFETVETVITEEKLTGVTVEMTIEEAQLVTTLLGKTVGGAYQALYDDLVGVVGSQLHRKVTATGGGEAVDKVFILTVEGLA